MYSGTLWQNGACACVLVRVCVNYSPSVVLYTQCIVWPGGRPRLVAFHASLAEKITCP